MATEISVICSNSFVRHVRVIWKRVLRFGRRAPKRLRLCESLPLGERRFVAVVEFDEARFLVGGTPSSLVLLSRLEDGDGGSRADEESVEGLRNVTAEIEITKRRGERC